MTQKFNKSAAFAKAPFLLFTLIAMSVSYAKGQPTTFFVVPTQPWDHTGVSVTAGESIAITATGLMDWDTNNTCPAGQSCTVRPDGQNPGMSCPVSAVLDPVFSCYSLIGKIGSGAPFEVGASFTSIAAAPGELYLSVNDGYFADNTLGWTAIINVSEAPEPSTWLLMALCGGLLITKRSLK